MFPFYHHYPGSDLHEIDLAYILKLCAELRASNIDLKAWKAAHEVEYQELKEAVDGLVNQLVDVIVPWDSSIEYPIYSIVEYQGTNYIAVQNVPVGAMITDTNYWQPANTVIEQINAIGTVVSDLQDNLYYTTPQEFGAVGDGVTDDTGAIAAAIATGKAVYIPEGIYKVTAPFTINNGQQIYGVGGGLSILRVDAAFSGNYVFISNDDVGHFEFSSFMIDCNDVASVGGIYAKRPYNMCKIKDVSIINCAYYALYMGADTTSISQTLVVENVLALGSTTTAQATPLALFNRVFELNLLNSKFMFRIANVASHPCVIFDYCYDMFVRGCSFTDTCMHGVELTNGCRYFTFVGNTYEHVGTDTAADGTQPTGDAILINGEDGRLITSGAFFEYPYYASSASHRVTLRYSSLILLIGTLTMNEDTGCYRNAIIKTDSGTNTSGSSRLSFDGPALETSQHIKQMASDTNYAELRHTSSIPYEIRNVENGTSTSLFRLANSNIYNLSTNGALILKDSAGTNHFIRVDTTGNLVVTNS